MGIDLKKVMKEYAWTPEDRDLKWTENYLNRGKKKFVWVTKACSVEIDKDEKTATLLEFDVLMGWDEQIHKSPFIDMSRIFTVLTKLGYKCDSAEPIVASSTPKGRFICNKIIDRRDIPQASY